MGVTLSEIARTIEAFAPLDLAEPWDRTGLQVGDPGSAVASVVIALDPSPKALSEAIGRGAQLLVTHHPLLLHPPKHIDLSTPAGHMISELLKAEVGLYSAHTNLDRADGGLNDALSERMGLVDLKPLTAGEAQAKLVTMVPIGFEPRVRRALFSAGAGRIGNYDGCTFASRGTGTFVPGIGASPVLGRVGEEERAQETRLEAVVPESKIAATCKAVLEAHPYEEPALDVYPLKTPSRGGSLGRVGHLAETRTLGDWARKAVKTLGAEGARLVGDPTAQIQSVAVCAGSGADLWRQAQDAGAQVLVTGDVKYHVALDALAAGFALLDVGHGPSERCAVAVLARVLADWAAQMAERLSIYEYFEPDPFTWLGR